MDIHGPNSKRPGERYSARLDGICIAQRNIVSRQNLRNISMRAAIPASELEALPVPHFAVGRPRPKLGRQASCEVYLQISGK
jgi:hypothetical protein